GEDTIRFGGTMEIGGAQNEIDMRRVKGIIQSIPKYYRDYLVPMPEKEKVWHGLRPCAPDGLPYVGKLKSFKNVVVASGHAMMGLSLAPATGLLVTELLENKKTSVGLELYEPERFY
ncbi:MAG: NAD(P)/FAD-dependent oxidoreductase, partial [Spirosomataceae bacterium]